MAFHRYMYTTNTRYADTVVGVGTLSSTPSAFDQGTYGFTRSTSVEAEDETPSCGPSQQIDRAPKYGIASLE